jgi:hypothetical protein
MFRRKRSDTRLGTIRRQYGANIAPNIRSDARLDTVLSRTRTDSLSKLLRNAGGKLPTKRIFIAFAMEDKFARDNLVFQAKQQANTPFDFIDMSVKKPWDSQWKTNCRAKIRGCDGLIAFISPNTPNAEGARWEIQCAKEEGIPIRGIWVYKDDARGRPSELGTTMVSYWTWDNIKNFLDSL